MQITLLLSQSIDTLELRGNQTIRDQLGCRFDTLLKFLVGSLMRKLGDDGNVHWEV